jgi:RNA-directed DNA polymerase
LQHALYRAAEADPGRRFHFHHRLVRSRGLNGKKQEPFLGRWPADKAVQRARDRIRELTCRSRLLLPVKWIVEDLNRFPGGWTAYFRFGNSAARFEKIRNYARMRLALFISKRHRRPARMTFSASTGRRRRCAAPPACQ